MVAALFAVVARHDDQGLVVEAATDQVLEERSEAVVPPSAGPRNSGPDLATVAILVGRPDAGYVEHGPGIVMVEAGLLFSGGCNPPKGPTWSAP